MARKTPYVYDYNRNKKQLNQGDLLRRTPELELILREFHPHYFENSDFEYFMVLTQSCDLVRRNNKECKSRYITIAAVRQILFVLKRLAEKIQYNDIDRRYGISPDNRKGKLKNYIERLLNNNLEGYFFLIADPKYNLNNDYCTLLQVSVTVKSEEHYETLLGAKVLQLTQPFQHKLGYLVGESYARIGTKDWVPDYVTPKEFNSKVNGYVKAVPMKWFNMENYSSVSRHFEGLSASSNIDNEVSIALNSAKELKEKERKETFDKIKKMIIGAGGQVDLAEKVVNRLRNDTAVMKVINKGIK